MLPDTLVLPPETPVFLPGAIQFDLASRHTGRVHRIYVYEPDAPAPAGGWPVITLTDGNQTFPLAASMDAAFARRGGRAALVVGVGYPTDDPVEMIGLRTRDLTPTQPACGLKDCGGAEAFFRFLTEELRPMIAANFDVNDDDQTLYGHSWGGLFALHVLFNHPGAYSVFAASNPSIWWDDRAVLRDEARLARTLAEGVAAPRVLISVGVAEPTGARCTAARERRARMLIEARMVDNARELAGRLEDLDAAPGYVTRYHAFEDDDHVTALPASIGRAMAFALRP